MSTFPAYPVYRARHERSNISRRTPQILMCGICLLLVSCGPKSAPSVTGGAPLAAIPPSPTLVKLKEKPTDVALRLALAQEYLQGGETFAAIEQLEVARSLGDSEASLPQNLAQRYDSVGEPEAAVEVLASAPLTPEIALPLSRAYLKLGDFQNAAGALRPLRQGWTTLPTETRQTIVRALLLAGDAETASSLLPKPGADPEWLALAGLQALIAGKYRDAATALDRSMARSPDTWNGYLLGRAWLAAGEPHKALEVWSAVAQAPDPPAQALIGAARLTALAGHLDAADRLMDQIQGNDHKLPVYWQATALIAHLRKQPVVEQIALGYAAYNNGDPWQAEALWRAALPQATDDLARQAYAALYNSAERRQDAQAALRYTTEAAKRWPQDPYFLRAHAEMALAQNLLPEALSAAQQFQTAVPPNQQAQAAELLARVALDSGKPDLLQQSVQRARTLAPADPMPILHLAEWQGQQGRDTANLERTLALYQEASKVAPTNAEAVAHAGLVLVDLKRTEEATTTLLHALTLYPRVLDGSPNALLSQLYPRQGRTLEAQFEAKQYQKVRALKDNWPNLLKLLRLAQPAPGPADWKALGEMALQRHENWIALCAFTRRARLTPNDPLAWQALAATQKRLGWFDEALTSMRHAHLLHPAGTTSLLH